MSLIKQKILTIITIVLFGIAIVVGGTTLGIGLSRSSIPPAEAVSDFVDTNGLGYKITDTENLTVSVSEYTGSATELVIPEQVTDTTTSTTYTVTGITGINISNLISGASNETGAFMQNETLQKVTIPATVTEIGEMAFGMCMSLQEIIVADSNTSFCVENGILYNINKTRLLTAPIGLNLTEIVIQNGVTQIDSGAFVYSMSLKSVTIPASVTQIGVMSFGMCIALEEINYNATSVQDNLTFANSEELLAYIQTIQSPGSFIMFSPFVYAGMGEMMGLPSTNLVINIGENVTKIPFAMFCMTSVREVTIPASVTQIGFAAFTYSGYLEEINLQATALTENIDLDLSNTVDMQFFMGLVELVTREEGVTGFVSPFARSGLAYLQGGSGSGSEPTSPLVINISEGVTNIPNFMFCMTAVSAVTIPESVTHVGIMSFFTSMLLQEINYNATNVANNFDMQIDFSNLESLQMSMMMAMYTGPFLNMEAMGGSGGSSAPITLNIGENVTTIPTGMFGMCGVAELNIPENSQLSTIGATAFMYANITELNIPNTVTSIGFGAFAANMQLTSVTIPENVTSIGGMAFGMCESLIEVNYNAISVAEIYEFQSLEEFMSLIESGSSSNPEMILNFLSMFMQSGNQSTGMVVNIGEKVTKIPMFTFMMTMTSEINFLGDSQCTAIRAASFMGNGLLTSVQIPNSVTKIGIYAFGGCPLTTASIGDGVTEIKQMAFTGCQDLSYVYFNNDITADTIIETQAFVGNASNVVYVVNSQESLTNIQAIYDSTSTAEETMVFTSNNFNIGYDLQLNWDKTLGNVISDSPAGLILSGVEVTMQALAYGGTAFLGWQVTTEVDGQSTSTIYQEPQITITVNSNIMVDVLFSNSLLLEGIAVSIELQDKDVNEVVEEIGQARMTGYTITEGLTYVHFSATSATGYKFIGWKIGGQMLEDYQGDTAMSADIPFDLVNKKQVTAVFAPIDNDHINDNTNN